MVLLFLIRLEAAFFACVMTASVALNVNWSVLVMEPVRMELAIAVLKGGVEGRVKPSVVQGGAVTALVMEPVYCPLADVTVDLVGLAAAVRSLSVQEGETVAGMEYVTVSIATLLYAPPVTRAIWAVVVN